MDPNTIEQFKSITNCDDHVAKFFLESAGGDVEAAITNYFNSGGSMNAPSDSDDLYGNDDDGDVNMTPQATPITSVPSGGRTLGGSGVPSTNYVPPQSTTSSTTAKKPTPSYGGGRKIASVRDFNSGDDDKPNSKDNKYYAGGSRTSGQQIIGGNGSDDDDDDHFADKIFKAAQERGAKTKSEHDDEQRRNKPTFEGSGRRLGNTEQSSSLIPSEQKRKEKEVTITFWHDGFTVDDGPLRGYDDPQNQQFMDAINKGFAPRELAEPGVDIAVNLINRKTDKYTEQPKNFKAFVGSGRSLGAQSSSSASSSSSSSTVTKPTTSTPTLKFEVDPNQPTTSLQIRLADGGRLVGKFNLNHTIGHIRQFIRNSKPSGDFDIMTQFPNKVLTDDHLTIEEAGLKGAAIIQKMK